jgi:hypothetical protein
MYEYSSLFINVRAFTSINIHVYTLSLWAYSKNWAIFDVKINEIGHQERISVDRNVNSH